MRRVSGTLPSLLARIESVNQAVQELRTDINTPTYEDAMSWRITDPEHLLSAMRVSLCQGGEFLVGRLAPHGPILRERCVSYIHKSSG